MPANNIDLYGKYIANTYSIVFMVDGNTYKTVQKEYKEVVGTISNPTKKGFTFNYWYTNDIYTEATIPETMPLNGLTLTAKFTINTDALNYYVDGAIVHTQNMNYNEETEYLYIPD